MKTTPINAFVNKFSGLVFLLFLSSLITACAVEENPNVVRFMFFADDGSNGFEPWASDGTAKGTALVKNIAPDAVSSVTGTGLMGASEIAYWRGRAYFAAADTEGSELWRSDGTASETKRFKNINTKAGASSSPANFKAYVNWLYFAAEANDGKGRELWRTDGSAENTYRFFDINTNGTGSSNPSYLTEYDSNLYFVADDGGGSAIWKTNGTASAGTSRVLIGTSPIQGVPQHLTVLNNKLCFSASDATNGRELWCYSSAASGSLTRITDINPGTENADPQFLTVFNGKLYFSADDGSTFGRELWVSSGGFGDAKKISVIHPSAALSNPHSLIVYKAALYFGADDSSGVDLWKYTGSAVPEMVQDIDPTANNSLVSDMKVFSENGQLYFVAHHTDYGNEIWVSNGTGASLFKDINPGPTDGFKPIP